MNIGIDLSNKSIDDLKKILQESEAALKDIQLKEKRQALENFVELVRDKKISYSDIMRSLRTGNAIYGSPNENGEEGEIYFNPNNPLEIYDGSGRKPKWMKDLEKDIFSINKYRIENKGYINRND